MSHHYFEGATIENYEQMLKQSSNAYQNNTVQKAPEFMKASLQQEMKLKYGGIRGFTDSIRRDRRSFKAPSTHTLLLQEATAAALLDYTPTPIPINKEPEFTVNYGSFRKTKRQDITKSDAPTVTIDSSPKSNMEGLFSIQTDYIDKHFNGKTIIEKKLVDLEEAEATRLAY